MRRALYAAFRAELRPILHIAETLDADPESGQRPPALSGAFVAWWGSGGEPVARLGLYEPVAGVRVTTGWSDQA